MSSFAVDCWSPCLNQVCIVCASRQAWSRCLAPRNKRMRCWESGNLRAAFRTSSSLEQWLLNSCWLVISSGIFLPFLCIYIYKYIYIYTYICCGIVDDHKPFSLGNPFAGGCESWWIPLIWRSHVLLLARPLAKIYGMWMGYEWDIMGYYGIWMGYEWDMNGIWMGYYGIFLY